MLFSTQVPKNYHLYIGICWTTSRPVVEACPVHNPDSLTSSVVSQPLHMFMYIHTCTISLLYLPPQNVALYLNEGENNDKFFHHPQTWWSYLAFQMVHNEVYQYTQLAVSLLLMGLAIIEPPTFISGIPPWVGYICIAVLCGGMDGVYCTYSIECYVLE